MTDGEWAARRFQQLIDEGNARGKTATELLSIFASMAGNLIAMNFDPIGREAAIAFLGERARESVDFVLAPGVALQ